jgi:putative oxidoreductase
MGEKVDRPWIRDDNIQNVLLQSARRLCRGGLNMDRWIGKYSEALYGIMRIIAGLLFACHGAQKLFGIFGSQAVLSNPLLIAAGIIEFVAGICIACGLLTGYAAFIASGEMAVAYFKMHAPGGFWPIVNKGELAVIYCFVFLYIASRGSGILSFDALRKKQ